jgi:AcrR family transcriptional regulator
MPVEGIRARNRAAIDAEIRRVAGEHLAAYGASGLSLRAIARDLGMASSAIYRYVASSDELLTQLIVAAYDSLGDSVESALESSGATTPEAQFGVIAHAFREWARSHPHEYALIYGSPVPDYAAPGDRTNPAGTRVPQLLVSVLMQLPQTVDSTAQDQRSVGELLGAPVFEGSGLSPGAMRRGLTAWILVVGAVSSEVFEQLGADTLTDPDAFFVGIVDTALDIVQGS